MHEDELTRVDTIATHLRVRALHGHRASHEPIVGIVLGSGLGGVADALADAVAISFGDVPHMPSSHVEGHAGRFVFGTLAGARVACMVGRVHAYEGHMAHDVVRGVRALCRLGASTFVLTNAAGGIREDLEPGAVMVIEDHLNLTGMDPGVGLGDSALGPRFPNLEGTWDADLRAGMHQAAASLGLALPSGVYAARLGPSYETPAEIRMLQHAGADAVGMSTVLEAIALRRMGARVAGLSCITNRAAGRAGAVLDHREVQAHAGKMAANVGAIVQRLVVSASASASAGAAKEEDPA